MLAAVFCQGTKNKNMKLELRHLAPYLPYQLKCTDGELIGIRNHIGWMGVFKSKNGEDNIPIASVIPILRPLSDLYKKEFEYLIEEINLEIEACGLEINEVYTFLLKNSIDHVAVSYEELTNILEMLYKNHFDLKMLIHVGLAYDVNTLSENGS